MRLIILILLIINMNWVVGQKIEFKVQFSEPLALFEFVSHITAGSPANSYKDVFDSSTYHNEKYTSLLAKFETINYFYWYEYSQYPYGSKIGGNTYFLLNKNLAESKSIGEFESKSVGIIPNADLSELSNTLMAFLPVYRELILAPNKTALKKQVTLLRKKIKETDISYLVEKIKTFHNSSWNTTKPFLLNICPTKASDGIHATAFFNYAFIDLPVNKMDMNLILSLMFHESFHIIYDEQSLDFKNQFTKWFKENPSKYSRYAELLFNEAITTALSSGYLFNILNKSPMPNAKWYNNKYIASMAVEIYPATLQYLQDNRQTDQDFVNGYIHLYESKFPEWISDINNIMADRFIIAEDKNVYRSISNKFRFRNIDEYANELTLQNLQKMKNLSITKMIALSKNKQESIDMIKQTFPELKNWAPDSSSDFSYSRFLADKTYLVIINSVTKQPADILQEIKLH